VHFCKPHGEGLLIDTGQHVADEERHVLYAIGKDNQRFVGNSGGGIRHVQREQDPGTNRCIARNVRGVSSNETFAYTAKTTPSILNYNVTMV
jgi:hypothetical protein